MSFDDGTGPLDVLALRRAAGRRFRQRIQMIFQDPVSSLSPRMTVLNILSEPLEIHGKGDRRAQIDRVGDLMGAVGLDRRFLNRYPHSFSGGQRQRIGIARALALNPDLIICDEPVSALDVSVQAQVLNLLKDLQHELGLTFLFISHNLAVIDYMADRIAVLAHGRIVELAPRAALFRNPVHPYTRALLAAVPFPDLDRPLDFNLLAGKSASDPARWGPAFRDEGDPESLTNIDLGDGHFVLARPESDVRDPRRMSRLAALFGALALLIAPATVLGDSRRHPSKRRRWKPRSRRASFRRSPRACRSPRASSTCPPKSGRRATPAGRGGC